MCACVCVCARVSVCVCDENDPHFSLLSEFRWTGTKCKSKQTYIIIIIIIITATTTTTLIEQPGLNKSGIQYLIVELYVTELRIALHKHRKFV